MSMLNACDLMQWCNFFCFSYTRMQRQLRFKLGNNGADALLVQPAVAHKIIRYTRKIQQAKPQPSPNVNLLPQKPLSWLIHSKSRTSALLPLYLFIKHTASLCLPCSLLIMLISLTSVIIITWILMGCLRIHHAARKTWPQSKNNQLLTYHILVHTKYQHVQTAEIN